MLRASRSAPAGPDAVRADLPDVAALICCTRSGRPAATTATAWHSAGSSRSSASRQIAYTPTAGPSRSTWIAPGSERSLPRPVEHDDDVGLNRMAPCGPAAASAFCRAPTMASSSAIRAVTVSASLPIRRRSRPPARSEPAPDAGSAAASAPIPSRPARLASVSTQIATSFGLCRAAIWATSQRPVDRGAASGPADAEHSPLPQRHGDRRVRDLPERPAAGARPASGRSARPRTAGPRCPPGAAGSQDRCGGAPTAACAARGDAEHGSGVRAVVPLGPPARPPRRQSGLLLDPRPVLAVLGHPRGIRTCGRACGR